ncbi:MAG: UDP-N-acetylmuramate--L-alanine ligase [Oscillospiraceae bacterium]
MRDTCLDVLNGKKHIHFIGIGGSGMFPLVQILHSQGYYITGSDNNDGDTIEIERKMGIKVMMGQRAENIQGADLIVYTAAILPTNEELIAAKSSGVTVLERSQLLGLVTSWFNDCICVCGTHGKTTTTSMVTQILMEAGLDPSAVIGGKLPLIGGNGRVGKSDIMVCEACEFVDTFLKLYPDIAVILNIDADHLDYFKTLDNIIKSFNKFAEMTTKTIIYNGDDANTVKAVKNVTGKKMITFGFNEKNDYSPANIKQHKGARASFELMHKGENLGLIELKVPGRHNVINAVAACAACIEAGVNAKQLASGIEHFKGAGRRFEILGEVNGVTIADDYAHHPAEVKATLETAQKMGYNKVWAVHQPFTYSRTAMLLDDFVNALEVADEVVLSEIMGSREVNTYNIYTKDLAEKLDNCVWFDGFSEIAEYVMTHAQSGDLVITLGCGDVYKCAKMMLNYSNKQ